MKKFKSSLIPARVACYCRVSTESQIENYSIDEQRDRLTAFCKARGWDNPKMYVDPGFSGGNIQRPALREIIELANSRKIDIVCVYKLDRLSRSQKDTLYLIEDVFGKNNVDFVSVCENFDTSSPLGKAMVGIISVFAQLEKDQITERFTMGRIGRAKNGLYHGGGNAPTGYDYVDGKLIVNDYQAEQVREIFKRFLEGKSIYSIVESMNNDFGGWNYSSKIYNILKNNIYIGVVKFGGKEYPGMHEPIITPEIFYKTQKLLSERSEKIPEPMKNPFRAGYMLSGLVYCGNCGAKYTTNRDRYICYSRLSNKCKYVKDPSCKNPYIKIEVLDSRVIREIEKAALAPEKIVCGTIPQKQDNRREIFENRLSEINAQISRLLDLYQFNGGNIEMVSQKLQSLEIERESISKQINDLPVFEINQQQEWLRLIKTRQNCLKTDDVVQKRTYVSALIRKVIIKPNGEIVINWRV